MKKFPEWKMREWQRFLDKQYVCPPWSGCTTCLESDPLIPFTPLKPIRDHFLHIATKDTSLVAYTKNEDHGVRDIQTQIKAGRYLKANYPDLNAEQIAFYAGLMQYITPESKAVYFAETADEIEFVYLHGPGSCMSKQAQCYVSNPIHPTRAYAGPDIRIAYIKDRATKKKIMARCVAWPDKKLYGRVYGDGGTYSNLLIKILEDMGYKNGSMAGARISIVRPAKEIPDYPGCFVAPYIDGVGRLRKEGEYLVIDGSGIIHGGSNGIATVPMLQCRYCSKRYEPSENLTGIRAELCTVCRETQVSTCEMHKGEVFSSQMVTVRVGKDKLVKCCNQCAAQKYTKCNICSFLSENDSMTVDTEGRMVCETCINNAELYRGPCKRCSRPVHKDYVSKRAKSEVKCKHCAYIENKEKQIRESGVEIDPKIKRMAETYGIADTVEVYITWSELVETLRGAAEVEAE